MTLRYRVRWLVGMKRGKQLPCRQAIISFCMACGSAARPSFRLPAALFKRRRSDQSAG
jgi:hypothetical protein